jgi:hypothetical protein
MNNAQRVDRLEERLGVNQPAETLDEMIEKFERGAYGGTLMSIVSGAMAAPDRDAFFDSLRKDLPGPLVDHFKDRIGRSAA